MQNITINRVDGLLCQLPNLTSLEIMSYRKMKGFRRFSSSLTLLRCQSWIRKFRLPPHLLSNLQIFVPGPVTGVEFEGYMILYV